jgi:hypothetical protein
VDESCGRLVPPNDANALAASLRELIFDSHLRGILGETARARAVEISMQASPYSLYQILRRALRDSDQPAAEVSLA